MNIDPIVRKRITIIRGDIRMPIRIAYALLVGIYLLIVTQNGGQVAVIFEQTPLFWQGLIAIVIALLTGCCIQLVQTPQPRWRFFEDQLLFTIPALLLTQRLLGWSFAGIVMLLIVAGLSIRLARTIEHRTIPSFLLSTVVGGTLLVAVALHICLRLYPVEFSRQLGVLNLVVLFLSIITLLIAESRARCNSSTSRLRCLKIAVAESRSRRASRSIRSCCSSAASYCSLVLVLACFSASNNPLSRSISSS